MSVMDGICAAGVTDAQQAFVDAAPRGYRRHFEQVLDDGIAVVAETVDYNGGPVTKVLLLSQHGNLVLAQPPGVGARVRWEGLRGGMVGEVVALFVYPDGAVEATVEDDDGVDHDVPTDWLTLVRRGSRA